MAFFFHIPCDRNRGRNADPLSYCCAILLLLLTYGNVRAESLKLDFESIHPSWQIVPGSARVRVGKHARQSELVHSGELAERIELQAVSAQPGYFLLHSLPPTPVFDQLEASAWIHSDRPGLAFVLRIRYPNQIDPRTGSELVVYLPGQTLQQAGQWSRLTCRTGDEAVKQRLTHVRAHLRDVVSSDQIRLDNGFVDAVAIYVPAADRQPHLVIDDLEFGPLVRIGEQPPELLDQPATSPAPLKLGPNRITLNGRPFVPRMMTDHGEDLARVQNAGINVVWLPEYDNSTRLQQVRSQGLWATATPPIDGTRGTDVLPLGEETSGVLFWNLGTQIPPERLRQVSAWANQVVSADSLYSQPRPLMADVTGSEREFNRKARMLGLSTHILHRTIPPSVYLEKLTHRRRLALLGTFGMTWLQTEPSEALLAARPAESALPVVEPEQIWLQTYAALASGFKAIGFWKFWPLDETGPGLRERELAISLVNTHIQLLEPWLATSKLVETVPVTVTIPGAPDLGERGYSFRNSAAERQERDEMLRERDRAAAARARATQEVRAAVFRGDRSVLVMPLWLEEHAQFQPGPMAATTATMTIIGNETRAWEITTTGLRPLQLERDTGGTRVTLNNFDQFAAILITGDMESVQTLGQHVAQVRDKAAGQWINLVEEKLQRVEEVHNRLFEQAPVIPDAPFLLGESRRQLQLAKDSLSSRQYQQVEQSCRTALQMLRKLQRTHWQNATERLSSPVSSQYAVCFQTLPDHWSLLAKLGSSGSSDERVLLKSGGFEDRDSWIAEGWQYERLVPETITQTRVQLDPYAVQGRRALRVSAMSAKQNVRPASFADPSVVVRSPAMQVYAGEIVHVRGRVKVLRSSTDLLNGFTISDSLLGAAGALRWRAGESKEDWQAFEMLREVPQAGDFQVIAELNGTGDVLLDDLQIVAIDPNSSPTRPDSLLPPKSRGPLDFLPRLPKFTPLRARSDDE